MNERLEKRTGREIPSKLRHIPQPPKQLYIQAEHAATFDKLMQRPRVAIVGSRKVSTYGQTITHQLAFALASRGVVVISGLAIGTDAVAHRAALEAGGQTIAVLPSPVEQVYPQVHAKLAQYMLQQGGALVSEYSADSVTYKSNFVERNRIVSGLADALLITEAAENSGTLHTAGFAMEQGIDVLVAPGNITSPTSKGTNNLIKTGATPITDIADILHALGIHEHQQPTPIKGSNTHEQQILDLIRQGMQDASQLLDATKLSIEQFNHHLTMLEISAKIRPLGSNQWHTA
jgi:DNA processing protein